MARDAVLDLVRCSRALTAMVFPERCPGCAGLPAAGSVVCTSCRSRLRRAVPVVPPAGVAGWAAAFAYEGAVREVIARAKYRNLRYALPWLSREAALVARPGIDHWLGARAGVSAETVVTWVPTTAARRSRRGFDHARIVAREIASRLELRAVATLQRADSVAQTGQPIEVRRSGPRFEFDARVVPANVVLVDDVATTGATLRNATAVLRDAGCRSVFAVTLARTPPPRS